MKAFRKFFSDMSVPLLHAAGDGLESEAGHSWISPLFDHSYYSMTLMMTLQRCLNSPALQRRLTHTITATNTNSNLRNILTTRMDYWKSTTMDPTRPSGWCVRQRSCRQSEVAAGTSLLNAVGERGIMDLIYGIFFLCSVLNLQFWKRHLQTEVRNGAWCSVDGGVRPDFSMTWSLLGEWNCQISSEFKNLRQSSTRIPSVKLPRTHLLASGHTYSMTGVMTICSRARIKFLKKIGHLSPEFRFTVNPHDGPNRLSDWGVTNGGCNSKSTQVIHSWSNALSLTWCFTDIERKT